MLPKDREIRGTRVLKLECVVGDQTSTDNLVKTPYEYDQIQKILSVEGTVTVVVMVPVSHLPFGRPQRSTQLYSESRQVFGWWENVTHIHRLRANGVTLVRPIKCALEVVYVIQLTEAISTQGNRDKI